DCEVLLDRHDHATVTQPLGDAHATLGCNLAWERAEGAEDAPGRLVSVRGRVVREPRQVEEAKRTRHPHLGQVTRANPAPRARFHRLGYVWRHGSSVHLLAVGRIAARVRTRR